MGRHYQSIPLRLHHLFHRGRLVVKVTVRMRDRLTSSSDKLLTVEKTAAVSVAYVSVVEFCRVKKKK
ncbi:hypothetical protein DAPPUDRAFT_301165 [Daphnia pulex]|uniref:Uncharacterized protein n=1 Tax=Daphnia pulex TaxID=6669 RepID=E9HGQ1_DAPPU|nr:hypothetical protein DAPPUDRAFT_301165 [Daphnia pulex]|eukprot:EFX69005.1 hypothetical protein DAPPUDRAFT_301165 [Daphnia pulex]